RLGAATASVHADMAKVLPTEPADDAWYATVAGQMNERLTAATEIVPQLAQHADELRALYAAVAKTREPVVRQAASGAAPVTPQGAHGALQLGELLRPATGWIVLNSGGEPARPLAVRREPDS